jgi:hypothetical protein
MFLEEFLMTLEKIENLIVNLRNVEISDCARFCLKKMVFLYGLSQTIQLLLSKFVQVV